MADYFDTGFCVRTASWHGKETLLAEHPENWDEARMAAGLMWEPTTQPLYRKVIETREATEAERAAYETEGYDIDAPGAVYWDRTRGQWSVDTERFEAIGHREVVRDDTREQLGVVSATHELITHAEMGSIVEDFLGLPNVKVDTLLSMKGGRQVAATILLDEPYAVTGDRDGFGDPVLTLPYFVILNSHDGTGACKGLYTQVRVVCANTYQAADMDGDRHGAQFSLRHTSGVKARLEDAREIVAQARTEAARWKALAEQLALITITDDQQLMFLSEFLPEPPAGIVSDRVRANIAKDRQTFMHLLNDSATNCEMSHTGLGLVNAAVEYLDHVRGFRNQDTYLGRQILTAEPLKAKAVRIVRELANA
jgi:phage/plasmid-like protein (TIGR03299 family)